MQEGDSQFMQRALQEAARARGRTHPNPMVGCVIVKNHRLIATGYHVQAGQAHAEVAALQKVGARARGADVYVTLEPCSHTGRVGPCADALIAAQVARVFVATKDPNPIVDGRGIKRLRAAGIYVHVGMLGAQSRALNEAFEHVMRHKRPWVVAKIAQSLDGRIATHTGASQWITGAAARRAGHMLRNELDAILVGAGTIKQDNPTLTCRLRHGRDPARVVLNADASIPIDSHVIQICKQSSAPTYICVTQAAPTERLAQLEQAGARIICCKKIHPLQSLLDLDDVLAQLQNYGLTSVLVEGGATVLGSFFDASLVNKVNMFIAPMLIGGSCALGSIGGLGARVLTDATMLSRIETKMLGPDWAITGYVKPKGIQP